jgi:hypothetical protein
MRSLVWAAFILLSFGGLTALIAWRRGRSPILWYVAGTMLGPVGLAMALGLQRRE